MNECANCHENVEPGIDGAEFCHQCYIERYEDVKEKNADLKGQVLKYHQQACDFEIERNEALRAIKQLSEGISMVRHVAENHKLVSGSDVKSPNVGSD